MKIVQLTDAMERQGRRLQLLETLKERYPNRKGVILFLSAFEVEKKQFEQASTIYYFYGLEEPASMIVSDLEGKSTLFIPRYSVDRSVWLPQKLDPVILKDAGIEHVKGLGAAINGCEAKPLFSKEQLVDVLAFLVAVVQQGGVIFTPRTDVSTEQEWVLSQLITFEPLLEKAFVAIDGEVASLRRRKSERELEDLHAAAEVTALAHEAAAEMINKGVRENEVQALIEYVFTQSDAKKAFLPIVGSGVNGTILHYSDNNCVMPDDSLVVVDCGAMVNHYCSDVTRVYPVSGKFSERQKKVYGDVLHVQKEIAAQLRPGIYLRNKEQPEMCLNSKARAMFKEMGYDVDKVFPHGIGHYVGLDVHDVGSYKEVLQEGDIVTIEPGIYLREEGLGVRIEDVYWIVDDGAVCLTDAIPKEIEEVERFMSYLRNKKA